MVGHRGHGAGDAACGRGEAGGCYGLHGGGGQEGVEGVCRTRWFTHLLLDCDGVQVDSEAASCEALRRGILEVGDGGLGGGLECLASKGGGGGGLKEKGVHVCERKQGSGGREGGLKQGTSRGTVRPWGRCWLSRRCVDGTPTPDANRDAVTGGEPTKWSAAKPA